MPCVESIKSGVMEQPDASAVKLVKYPAPSLRGPCAEIEEFGRELRALAGRMFEIMYASGGVGLAAPQVGLAIRLFVANPTARPGEGERVYVNPEFVRQEGARVAEEGCLSVPGVVCRLKRPTRVTVRAKDLDGNEFQETGEDLLARIFQHEMDHINGMLIVDRMSAVAKLSNRRALKDLEEKYAEGDAGEAGI
jgi:peptide deformylase